jgi:hypothetical protein
VRQTVRSGVASCIPDLKALTPKECRKATFSKS